MTITELIEKLEICKKEFGDLVVVDNNYMFINSFMKENQKFLFNKLKYLPDEFLIINFNH